MTNEKTVIADLQYGMLNIKLYISPPKIRAVDIVALRRGKGIKLSDYLVRMDINGKEINLNNPPYLSEPYIQQICKAILDKLTGGAE